MNNFCVTRHCLSIMEYYTNRNFGPIKEPDVENGHKYNSFTKQELVPNGQRKTGSSKEPTQATGTGENSALVGITSLSLYTNLNPEEATEAGTGDIVVTPCSQINYLDEENELIVCQSTRSTCTRRLSKTSLSEISSDIPNSKCIEADLIAPQVTAILPNSDASDELVACTNMHKALTMHTHI